MSLPVLLIGFNRPDLIESQLNLISTLGVRKIYVSIDGGRDSKERAICDKTAQITREFKFSGQVLLKTRENNLGCGLGVVSALDWFFSLENLGVVLEDDCVPNIETMEFFQKNKDKFDTVNNLGMISAHNPCTKTESDIYSSYIFINGWMMKRETYSTIRKDLFKITSPIKKYIPGEKWRLSDAIFWWSSSTRVKLGKHDTWDSPFLERFASLKLKCLVPSTNLIKNVGFGESASHTKDKTGSILIPLAVLPNEVNQSNFDSVVRKIHFKVKPKHAFTPLIRVARDFLSFSRRDFEGILSDDRQKTEQRGIEFFP